MSDAAPSRRMFPGYTLKQLQAMVETCQDEGTKAKMAEEIAKRESGASLPFVVPQVSAIARRAAAPLVGKKAQEFDTSSLPLYGDGHRQGSLF